MPELGQSLALGSLAVLVALVGCATPQPSSDGEELRRTANEIALEIDTPREALEAGYEPEPRCIPDMGVHWVNPDLVDTELNVSQPEAVLFLPETTDVDNASAGAQQFLGVEYIAVTQGTEHNASDNPPTLEGVPLDGPMPGHSPGMPWHADLHVYLASELDSDETFPSTLSEINCPPGTTPPGTTDDGAEDRREAPPASCRQSLRGERTHEHARIELYLNSSTPYDLSPERYQLAHRSLHVEAGELDAGGAIAHIHEARPSMACLLETLGFSVTADRIVTDTKVAYQETADEEFEVFVDGSPSPHGLNTPLEGDRTYVLRFNSSAPPTPCPGLSSGSVHDHATLEVFLNSSVPWDFSAPRYQSQAGFVAFEDGPQDADGARVHVHQPRPSLSCLFSTIGWEVHEGRIETDTGDVFEAGNGSTLEVLADGEPVEEGFWTSIERAHHYEVHFNETGPVNATEESSLQPYLDARPSPMDG